MRYNNYHKHDHKGNVRSLDVTVKLEDYCKRAVELGHNSIFSTNHGMQGDLFEATTLAKQYNLKLIVGCECYYVSNRYEKDRSNRHLIVIALNDYGVRELNKMLSIANDNGYYYKPRIDHELLFNLNPNNFIITTACVAGILKDNDLVLELYKKFGNNFLLEVQNHDEDIQREFNLLALSYHKKYGIKLIHGNDSHYIIPEDSKYRELFLKAKGIVYENEGSFILDYPDADIIIQRYKKQGVLSEQEIMESIQNTLIFDRAETLTLINDDIKLPSISDNPNRELKTIVNEAWKKEKHNIPEKKIQEYANAIKYEMDIIEKTHMENYFIIDNKIAELAQSKYGGKLTNTGRGCFTEDALIHTKDTIKSIKDVQVGEYVITKDGKFNRVLNTMQYDINEELVKINHLYGTDKNHPTICTLDHKILAKRNNDIIWVEAQHLRTTDYVCVPKMKLTDRIDTIIDLNDYNSFGYQYDNEYIYEIQNGGVVYPYSPSDVARNIGVSPSIIKDFANLECKKNLFRRKKDKFQELMNYLPFNTREEYAEYITAQRTKKIKRFIHLDREFNTFIGLMYGDGFTHDRRKTGIPTSIGLAINSETEKDKFNRNIFKNIAYRLNLDMVECKSKNKKLSQLYIHSKVIANFVSSELFYSDKNLEKQFNSKWFYQDKENLIGIIDGLRMSDGSFEKYRISFDNTSKSLINAYKLLCLMTEEGVNSLSIRKPYKTNDGYICKESYKLRLNKNSNTMSKKDLRTYEDENYFYLPLTQITFLPKQKTKVYDITVENEHNYLLNNMIVHNSAPSFIINKLLGLTDIDRLDTPCKLFPTRFMSTERILGAKSLPDIDLNTANREPFIQATKDLLGDENCAWMISWKPLQESSGFRLYCKAIGMDIKEYDEIAKDLDMYREDKQWKGIIEESKHFIGVVESISESPCSMLLYNKPVAEEIGLIRIQDKLYCMLDGYNCDKYKYLKNDYLQVTIWAIIKEVCDMVGMPIPSIKELNNLLDEKTFNIYKEGLTCTINQVDSDWATGLVKKYQISSLSEASQFVAMIRPGCASLLSDFLDRKQYTTGVKELDELLEDSEHRLIYQESIMKYLIWLGVSEPHSYDIIKKIAKKKFKEKELEELKTELKQGWLKQVGSMEGFEATWTVVEQASRYSFNASHSLSYAYDSLYGAYLKSHYPLEYYSVVLNHYSNDETRTKKLTNELDYFGIKILPPKFRYSKAVYSPDKNTNTIYKGISSIKYLNAQVSDELYDLRDNQYGSFMDLLIDITTKTSTNSRQLNILIKLDYFSEFGKSQKLLKCVEYFNLFNNKKQIKKDKVKELGINEDIIKKYSNETEKQYNKLDSVQILKELYSTIDNKPISLQNRIQAELEYLGYISFKEPRASENYYVVTEYKTYKNKTKPYITLYQLKTGNIIKTNVKKGKTFVENPFKLYSVLKVLDFKEEYKKKLIDGKWTNTDEKKLVLNQWQVI